MDCRQCLQRWSRCLCPGGKRLDLNKLAREITLKEGKKISLPIGQVKEVVRLTLERLAEEPDKVILGTVRYRGK